MKKGLEDENGYFVMKLGTNLTSKMSAICTMKGCELILIKMLRTKYTKSCTHGISIITSQSSKCMRPSAVFRIISSKLSELSN